MDKYKASDLCTMYYNFASRYLVRYQPLVTLLKPQLAPQLFVMFHHLLKILVVLSRILPLTMSLLTISKQIAGNFRGGGGGGGGNVRYVVSLWILFSWLLLAL